MHHLEIIGEVGGEEFFDQTGLPDIALLMGGDRVLAEQAGHGDVQRLGDVAQIGDAGLGFVALHLTEPADGTAQRLGQLGQRQPTGFAQRPKVCAKRLGLGRVSCEGAAA